MSYRRIAIIDGENVKYRGKNDLLHQITSNFDECYIIVKEFDTRFAESVNCPYIQIRVDINNPMALQLTHGNKSTDDLYLVWMASIILLRGHNVTILSNDKFRELHKEQTEALDANIAFTYNSECCAYIPSYHRFDPACVTEKMIKLAISVRKPFGHFIIPNILIGKYNKNGTRICDALGCRKRWGAKEIGYSYFCGMHLGSISCQNNLIMVECC